jgi:hypothetical protein
VTADANLVCRRCGYTNVPGDTFCGSCGAFLEWEGEHAADAPTTPTPIPAPPPGPGPVAGPGPSPAPTPPVTPTPVAGPAGGELLRCPACGVANAASRTFCQACGTKLGEAGKVGAVSQDQIVAAVNAPNKPITVTTTTIRKADPDEGGGGGVVKWIAIMAILGVIVGVAVVLGGNLLRGEGPQSGASPGASLGVVSPSPDGSGGDLESEAPSGEPTEAPQNEPLALTGATASSVVGNREKFQPTRAIDGDPETAWQEGAEDEAGQWIEVSFAPSTVGAVRLTNGYNASKALYRGNQRLREIEITVDDGVPFKAELEDTGDPQTVNIPNVEGATRVRITILSTYPAKKTAVQGTPFDDAALGEIVVLGVPGS